MVNRFDPLEIADFEDYIRELGKLVSFWAEKVTKMPREVEVPLRTISDKMIAELGFLHTLAEDTLIHNRIELSEAARKLDETEKLLRHQIDRDASRVRDFLDSFLSGWQRRGY